MIKKFSIYYPLIPAVGLCLFVLVFTIAALDYPGGSENIPEDIGYSFFHNFLCDVMNPVNEMGTVNPARPLATVAHFILSASMIMFFFILPQVFDHRNLNTQLVRFVGMLSMTVFAFMFTSVHDQIVTATGVIGTFALIPFFMELRTHTDRFFKTLSIVCFALSIIVFLIFETKIGFFYLPFIQKITFLFDAWWVIMVGMIVLKKEKASLVKAG